MIRILVRLTDDQKVELQNKVYSLDNICVCDRCNAMLQFNVIDVEKSGDTPYLKCPCGDKNPLPSKYAQMKPRRLDYVYN